jgi:hypothetical protein
MGPKVGQGNFLCFGVKNDGSRSRFCLDWACEYMKIIFSHQPLSFHDLSLSKSYGFQLFISLAVY